MKTPGTLTRLLFLLTGGTVVAFLVWFTWPALVAARKRLPAASGDWITDLIRVSSWPAIVLVALVLLRKQIGALGEAIANRASKVSILNLEIELAQSSKLKAWPTPAIQGIKEADGAVLAQDSGASLFQELHGTPADFAVVNLGQGREWLTSRVYILATLVRRMRALRAIVFLTTSPGQDRLFLGLALPDNLRNRFDYRYPWLGARLQAVYKSERRSGMVGSSDDLEPIQAQRVLRFYIEDLRKKPDDAIDAEWTEVRPGVYEHASWLDTTLLTKLLGSDLERSVIEWKPTLGRNAARDVLTKSGTFVALVDRSGSFRDSLIDRTAMIEAVAHEVAPHL